MPVQNKREHQMNVTEELVRLGLREGDGSMLFLVPMAIVAWADGTAEMDELWQIADYHAEKHCEANMICLSEEARQYYYYNLIYQRPDEELQTHLINLLAQVLDELPEKKATKMRDVITSMCVKVAGSAGGILGLFRKISCKEKQAIGALVAVLKLREGTEANKQLADVDI